MPLYDYECEKCGKVFEVRQKFAEEPLKTHPECGGEVHRLLSAPAIQFKGSGWYVTDYGKGGKSLPSNGKSESTSEKKTETKPESKSEAKPSTTVEK